MNVLAIDTATSLASIALSVNGAIAGEALFNTDRTLSSRLIPEIDRLLTLAGLTPADIDLFAASTGPGSFTGVRGGVATIQGLALAGGRPCVGFSSLTLLALNLTLAAHPVCPLLDARKSEVYGALFDCSAPLPAALIGDAVLPPERFLQLVGDATADPVVFCGDGAVRYRELIAAQMGSRAIFAPFPLNAPHAARAIPLAENALRSGAATDPARLLPTYLRPSEAELNRPAKL